MAVDALVGLGADLFGGGLADIFGAGLGDVAATAGADVLGAGAADAAGAGAADLAAADLAGGGALAGGAITGDLGAAAGDLGAADLAGGAAGAGVADLGGGGALSVLPGGEAAALSEGLGDSAGGLAGALDNAPQALATPADTAASPGGTVGDFTANPSGAAANNAASGAGASASTSIGAPANPTQAIQNADTNIASQLDPNAAESSSAFGSGSTGGPSTQQAVGSASAAGDVANVAAGGPGGSGGGVTSALNGAGGATGALSSVLNSPWTKAAELGLPLGFLGYEAIKGPAPIPPQANQAVANAENQLAPLQGKAQQNVDLYNATAAEDLNLANNFQISPQQAAAIQVGVKQAQNQLYQQIANEGNADPMSTTMWVEGNNQIQQQALAQQVQMINQLITAAGQFASAANAGVSTATNVTSTLDATLMSAAQLQVQQDQAFQQALSSALQSFGLFAGLSSVGKGTNPTA